MPFTIDVTHRRFTLYLTGGLGPMHFQTETEMCRVERDGQQVWAPVSEVLVGDIVVAENLDTAMVTQIHVELYVAREFLTAKEAQQLADSITFGPSSVWQRLLGEDVV